jgi:hypothetical protein
MSKNDKNAPKTAKKTPKKVSKSAAATMATRSAMAMATKSAEEDENPQMNNLTASKSAMSTDQAVEKILTMVMSRGDKQDNQINKQDNQIDKMADIMRTMSDTIKSMRESYQTLSESFLKLPQRVDKQESEAGDIKADFQMVDSAIGNIKETDSLEIFKELAWREERSRELILFKIDESESNSWNKTKTYERTELVKTINKVCDFDESEVVFIR